MRHVFIINPAAGKQSCEGMVRRAAAACFAEPPRIFVTRGPGDAARIARREAEAGGPVRLYACGGDGTLSQVAAGALGFSEAEVACVPAGSGNDYIRNFGRREDFLDLAAQAEGLPVKVDMIDCGFTTALNVCSCGYDAEVAVNLEKFKKLPISGAMTYALSCAYTLTTGMVNRFDITVDGRKFSQDFLLAAFCCGGWYGSGFHVAPQALPGDGLLDFELVDTVSILKFVRMVGQFRAGRHENLPMIHPFRGRGVSVRREAPFPVSIDGEIFRVAKLELSVMPGCLSFVLPRGRASGRPRRETAFSGKSKE